MLNHQLVVTDERKISSIFYKVPPQRRFAIIMYFNNYHQNTYNGSLN